MSSRARFAAALAALALLAPVAATAQGTTGSRFRILSSASSGHTAVGTSVTFYGDIEISLLPYPTGPVAFLDGSTPIAGCEAVPLPPGLITTNVTAVCVTNALVTGPHTITAMYAGDAVYAPKQASMAHVVDGNPDLSIAVVPHESARSAGRDQPFTLVVTNNGQGPAPAVVLSADIPAGATLAYKPPTSSVIAGKVNVSLQTIDPGQARYTTIVVRPAAAGPLALSGSVTTSLPDLNPADNSASANVAIAASPAGAPVTRYRLFSPVTLEHHYTTDANEYAVLGALAGTWVQEGASGQVLDNPGSWNGVEAVPYYRLYFQHSRQHHWTTDPNEYYTWVVLLGYPGEGVDGFILPTQAPGTIPLYRLRYPVGPHSGLHHWTIDPVENGQLISVYGWVSEGGSGFVIP